MAAENYGIKYYRVAPEIVIDNYQAICKAVLPKENSLV
jgi:hypothetical protein